MAATTSGKRTARPRQRRLARAGITGHTHAMKTAVSMPDDLFAAIDARAKALKLSRSALLARAAREFLDRLESPGDPTALWNRAIERGGQPGTDPAAAAFMRRTKTVIRGASRSKR